MEPKDIQVVVPGNKVGYRINNPINTDDKSQLECVTTSNMTTSRQTHNNDAVERFILNNFLSIPIANNAKRFLLNHHISPTSIIPIAALRPYQNRWKIKARVTNKSTIRTWSNSRGEGKFFAMDLIDESGEIRCVAFKKQCDIFYDLIKAGNVYYISGGRLKMANKQFNTLKNDYEMIITDDTEIWSCHRNNDNIPMMHHFDFCPLNQVENMEKNDIIDVLGVVTTFEDVQHVVQRSTGRGIVKRGVNIMDDSGAMICVTLWEKHAEDFDGSNNPILAIKGARVNEFNGRKNLSLLISSVLEKNSNLSEAHKLREWYTAAGHLENVNFLSRPTESDFSVPLYTFQEVTESQLGEKLNFNFYKIVATINLIRIENSIYKACPIDSCRKKLIEQSTGIFRCKKCNKDYPNFVYRLLANMNIADATGNHHWIVAFNEIAENILGMSAQELGELKKNNINAYIKKFDETNFKRFTFSLKVKSEVFQNEMRMQHICTSLTPLNYKTHLAHLINKVSKLVHIEKWESD